MTETGWGANWGDDWGHGVRYFINAVVFLKTVRRAAHPKRPKVVAKKRGR